MLRDRHLIIATRGSRLALWQANHVKQLLESLDPTLKVSFNVIRTRGDAIQNVPLAKVGGKGLFVKEIEEAILDGRADMAVHSIKDMPMTLPENLILGCVLPRADCTDTFLSYRYSTFEDLPANAVVGTSSLRRQAQLLGLRPDLKIVSLRGNIDTRMSKLEGGEYDAIVLANAGLTRLGLKAPFMHFFEPEILMPAVAQGALGIECHEDNYDLLVMLASLEDRNSRVCVESERAFLKRLDGGCQVPIGAHAVLSDDDATLQLNGLVAEPDGTQVLRSVVTGDASRMESTGISLAEKLLDMGADKILEKLYPAKTIK